MRRETEIPAGHQVDDTHGGLPFLALLKETHRQREDLMRPELGLQRQIKSIARREAGATTPMIPRGKTPQPTNGNGSAAMENLIPGDPMPRNSNGVGQYHIDSHAFHANANSIVFFATVFLDQCRAELHRNRLIPELRMKKLAKQLPVWGWVESIPGFGALGLAQIIAETGDLNNYANPGKVWKRLGLAVDPEGGRQRKVKDKETAIWMGFSPRRRSVMWNIGESAIKKQGYYREVYLARKEYEKATTLGLTPGHYHAKSRRYMEKRFIKHLWQRWRKQPIID